jgi:HSP20 family molecular chaperone IbpA
MTYTSNVREYPALWAVPSLLRGSLFSDAFFRDSLVGNLEHWFRDSEVAVDSSAWPRLQVHNSDRGYELSAELPGLSEKDVELTVNKGILTLSGSRAVRAEEGYKITRRERPSLRFSRSVQLPDDVDGEKVEATLKDGLLRVFLPKRANVQPRKIAITGA